MEDLSNWKGCSPPQRKIMEGRFVQLEPLDPIKHGDELHVLSSGEGAAERLRQLFLEPQSRHDFQKWLEHEVTQDDPIYFATIDKDTGKVGGRLNFKFIDPPHGAIEIGGILWGPLISRRPAATEAMYLCACYVFDELGYRRLEWRCYNDNPASMRAADRFGFTYEGIIRQNYVLKGENRDMSVYSILDKEWPALKPAYEKWLDASNFDENGTQKKRLEDFRV